MYSLKIPLKLQTKKHDFSEDFTKKKYYSLAQKSIFLAQISEKKNLI